MIPSRTTLTLASLLLLLLTLSACATRTATPTPSPSVSPTRTRLPGPPSATPRSTSTPRPPATPTATRTRIITPWPTARAQIGTPPVQPAEVIAPENVARLAALAQWHEDRVQSIAWTAEGDLLAARGNEVVWYAYDGSSLVVRKRVALESDVISVVANARWIAVGLASPANEVVAWPVDGTPNDVRALRVRLKTDEGVRDLMLSDTLLAGLDESRVRAWELPAVASARPLTLSLEAGVGGTHMALSLDGAWLATESGAGILRVRSLAHPEQAITLPEPPGEIKQLAFSADGQWLAALSNQSGVILWRLRDGTLQWTYANENSYNELWNDLVFVPNTGLLAVATTEGVRLFRMSDGTQVGLLAEVELTTVITYDTRIASLTSNGEVTVWKDMQDAAPTTLRLAVGELECFTPDSTKLILSKLSSMSLYSWRVESGQWQTTWRGAYPGFIDGVYFIGMFTCASNGAYAARVVGSTNDLERFDLTADTMQSLWKEHAPTEAPFSFTISPDGNYFGVVRGFNFDWSVRTIPDGQVVVSGTHALADTLQFTPDGHGLLFYSPYGKHATLLHWPELTPWVEFIAPPNTGAEPPLLAVQFSADSTTLALVSARHVTIWDLTQNRLRAEWPLIDHDAERGAALSPDGRVLVTTRDGALDLWDTADGTLLHTLGMPTAVSLQVTFAPNGRWLAVGWNEDENVVMLWGVP